MVEQAKLSRRRTGELFHCIASRRAGQHALTFRLTYKEGKKSRQFQATCEHHPPERFANAKGRPYTLACRRTLAIGKAPNAERECIKRLLRWVRSAPLHEDRGSHQSEAHKDMDESSSSSSSDSSGDEGSPSSAPKAKLGAPSRVVGRSGDPASSRVASGIGDLGPSRVASSIGDPAPPRVPGAVECWLCGGQHADAMCDLYPIIFGLSEDDDADHIQSWQTLRALGGIGASRPDAFLEEDLVQTSDVPGDGNCMFHAAGREVLFKFKGHVGLPADPMNGQSWRTMVMDFVAAVGEDCLDGTPINEWIALQGEEPRRYLQRMRAVRNRRSWGGMFELALLAKAWEGASGEALCIVMLQRTIGGYKLLSFAGPAAGTRIFVAWLGAHWVRCRVKSCAMSAISIWMRRD
jgi:hypothetical protein